MSGPRLFRRLAAAVALAASIGAHAATAVVNDVTDLWFNPDESGWGVNLIQQANVAFATLFVHDEDGRAHWFVGSELDAAPASAGKPVVFVGKLYETTGPVFSASAFDPAKVTVREVGRMTFEFPFRTTPASLVSIGRLTYTVDGVTVVKQVQRQTWAFNDLSGQYYGVRVTQISPATPGCSTRVGTQVFDSIDLAHLGGSLAMTATHGSPVDESCRYTGAYVQEGHMGTLGGTYSCSSGANGTFTLSQMEGGRNGFFAAYAATDRTCLVVGNFSAVRKN
jgi:hypothetical protein